MTPEGGHRPGGPGPRDPGVGGSPTYILQPMTGEDARAIAAWHYDGTYAFYDADQDPEDLADLLNPASWTDGYIAAYGQAGELVGFFSFNREDSGDEGGTVTVGLGLRPDLTGRGLGLVFLEAGLEYARRRYHPRTFRLFVATFNQRGIRVYERAGFIAVRTFLNRTNGSEYEFLEMTRPA